MLKTFQELIAEVAARVRGLDANAAHVERTQNQGLLIDVREPGEVAEKAAAGSHAIPRGMLELKITQLAPDPGLPLYLHCAGGGRARLAAEQLQRMGYTNVTAVTCPLDEVCKVFGDG